MSGRHSISIYLLYVPVAFIVLVGGLLLAVFVLHPWSMVFMLAVVWAITTAATTWLWLSCLHSTLSRRRMLRKAPGRSRKPPVVTKVWHMPASPYFPVTPMPVTPLVRVLETIDLSSTSVEHFLDTNTEKAPEKQIPESQMAVPIDGLLQHMDMHVKEHVEEQVDENE